MSSKTTVVISTGRSEDPARRALEHELAASVQDRPDFRVVVIPHLTDLAPEGPAVQSLRSVAGPMIVLAWLYPRAAYWILDANLVQGRMGRPQPSSDEREASAGSEDMADDAPQRTIWCLDLRSHSQAEPLLEEIRRIAAESAGEEATVAGSAEAAAGGKTHVEESTGFRWYPVIDYSRCQSCMECSNFCLFGVFGLDESQRIFVEQPDACRDGCPACSRVCPNQAIVFPEHHTPVIAGDPTAAADGFNLSLVQLLGPASPLDLAAAERDRAAAERDRAAAERDRAAAERDRALAEKVEAEKAEAEKDDLDRLVDDLDEMEL